MVRCDDCHDDVLDVWRHGDRTESMTHRRIQWLCRACHPDVHAAVETASPGRRVVTDAESGLSAD